jgi:hypothetical protein
MIVFDAPVEPDALTTFVREVPVPGPLALTQLFAGDGPTLVDRNYIEWAEVTRTNRTARFRTFDGRLHVSSRDGAETKRVNLPPLSSSLSMGEYERLQLEFARTGGTNQQALARSIYNDGENLTREVLYRMEQAIGDVLTDGKLTLNEGGLVSEADFAVPGGHLVAPGTLWSNTSGATVLTNLVAWNDVYIATNGFGMDSLLTSTSSLRLVQRNAEIINAVHGSAAGRTRVTRDELNDLLASEGLPTFREPYDTVVDVDGVSTRVIPADRVIGLPPDPESLVDVTYGVSATALELVGSSLAELDFEEAPGIVGVVEKAGPPYRQFTFVDAVGMPVLSSGRRLLVADVA